MDEEARLLRALRSGDEAAFSRLVDRYNSPLLRVAMIHVGSRAVAEEVVQETWLAVVKGVDRFEGRSSLVHWIFRIATNIAKTRGERESRCRPFSSFAAADGEEGPSIDPDRFFPPDHPLYPNHWAVGPTAWTAPEEGLLSGETRTVILRAVEQLPPAQRTVITLRDLEGWPADEVCEVAGVSAGNQRVLLHRARARVRSALVPLVEVRS